MTQGVLLLFSFLRKYGTYFVHLHMCKKYIPFVILITMCCNCKEVQEQKASPNTKAPVKLEKQAVKSTYEDLDGNPIELEDYKGKRIFLNYWATWCGPCIEEMPSILTLKKVLEKENFVFLLASDQSTDKINAFKKAKNFDFEFIKFNGAYGDLQITALPVTFLYNEAGEQVERVDGGIDWDASETIQKLKQIH